MCLKNNLGLNSVSSIRDILLNITLKTNLEIEYNPTKLTCMKYAPIIFVNVERSFTCYNAMLGSNCHFKFENFFNCMLFLTVSLTKNM